MNQDTELRGFSIAGAYPLLISFGEKTIEIRYWVAKDEAQMNAFEEIQLILQELETEG
jgi:hypothetical protein